MIFIHIADLIWQILPMLALFALFLIGYALAYNDFTPKPVTKNETFSIRAEPKISHRDFESNRRELSNAELGLHDLDSMGQVNLNTQREHRLADMIRDYSAETPENAAEVIKMWLHEK